MHPDNDFEEQDEDVEQVKAAFAAGEKGKTRPRRDDDPVHPQ